MRGQRLVFVVVASAVAGSVGLAQPGRGGSQWLTSLADAQRTSWVRTDEKISVGTLSKPGFEQQWKAKLDNQPRGPHGLGQGVTASGVTLFVPISLVTGSSNNVYAIDNDTGYVVWQRHFDATLPASTSGCPGGITAGATRIVSLGPSATAPGAALIFGGRGAVGYRSLLGEPGEGVPVEGPAAGRGRAGGDPSPESAAAGAAARGAARPAPPAPPAPAGRASQAGDRIPGAPRREESGAFAMLFRPSGVGYVVSSDGMLHVLGLASGKDLQRPAPFLPANARWSAPVAVDTTLYAATSGNCGGAPSAVWAIDLDSEAKPVVSWKTNGGDVIGEVAFTSDGTLVAAIGAGNTTGDGKANAIVALDAKTLQLKDWFTQPAAEFVTGPTILHRNGKDIVAAATKDGRILLLDAGSLGRCESCDAASCLEADRWRRLHGERSARDLAAAGFDSRDNLDPRTCIRPPLRGKPRPERDRDGRCRRCAEAARRWRRRLPHAGVGLSRPDFTGYSDDRQRCRLHPRDGQGFDSDRTKHPSRPSRVRR